MGRITVKNALALAEYPQNIKSNFSWCIYII